MNNFDDLKTRVNIYAEDCTDEFAQLKSLKLVGDNLQFVGGENNLFGKEAAILVRPNDWAFRQVCERIDAPPLKWFSDDRHCPSNIREKLFNDLVEVREDARLFMRMKGETLRAVLSDEYTKFDNTALVNMLGDALDEMGYQAEVHRAEVGDELRAYILFPQVTFAGDPGAKPMPMVGGGLIGSNAPHGNGGLHPAIYISNSERGGGSARVTGAVYRSVCTNGVIFGWNATDLFTQRHRFVSMNAMSYLIAEGIAVAIKMSEQAALAFVASQEIHLEKPRLKGLLDDMAGRYGLTVEAKENWLQVVAGETASYGRQDDPRVFDVVNAATYVAQQRSPDEREMMERMAGDMLLSYTTRRNREE